MILVHRTILLRNCLIFSLLIKLLACKELMKESFL